MIWPMKRVGSRIMAPLESGLRPEVSKIFEQARKKHLSEREVTRLLNEFLYKRKMEEIGA